MKTVIPSSPKIQIQRVRLPKPAWLPPLKHWQPKTIRLAAACARLFFVEQLGHQDWTVFSQIGTRDHDRLPAVMTRAQVVELLRHIRLRRYRTPIKLIYCCGLPLSECLNVTIRDIRGAEDKLWVRGGKGGRDRLLPICPVMVEDLRRYWRFHRHPLLLFPNVCRGSTGLEFIARYLRHVLPRGLKALRHYGFCHPAAAAQRERLAIHTGMPLHVGAAAADLSPVPSPAAYTPTCPCCGQPMKSVFRLPPRLGQTPSTAAREQDHRRRRMITNPLIPRSTYRSGCFAHRGSVGPHPRFDQHASRAPNRFRKSRLAPHLHPACGPRLLPSTPSLFAMTSTGLLSSLPIQTQNA